jgi:hypothetical protein
MADEKKKNQSLTVTFASAATATSESDWLTIVQADRLVDQLPKNEFAFWQWVRDNGYYDRIYNNAIDSSILIAQLKDRFYGPCEYGTGGTIMIGLKVVKNRSNLDYKLVESYGLLHFNRREEAEAELHIDVSLTDTIEIRDHRILTVLRQSGQVGRWEGMPFKTNGDQTSSPSGGVWDADTQTITFDQPYFGTFKFQFVEEYDSWSIAIPPRTNVSDIYDIDLIYDSTVRAFYTDADGDPHLEELPIEIPEEARECIQYLQDANGDTYIAAGNTYGYDFDGDGEVDYVSDDPCACFFCGETGVIPGCKASATVDCTCPVCEGTGRYPGCDEQQDSDYGGGSTDDTTDPYGSGSDGSYPEGYGDCYELRVTRNRCTDEVIDEQAVKVPCPKT